MREIAKKCILGLFVFLLFGGVQVAAEEYPDAQVIEENEEFTEFEQKEGEKYTYKFVVPRSGRYKVEVAVKGVALKTSTLELNGETIEHSWGMYSSFDPSVDLKAGDNLYIHVTTSGNGTVRIKAYELTYLNRILVRAEDNNREATLEGWSYDPVTRVLTLDNFNGSGLFLFDLAYNEKIDDICRYPITVEIKGENHISCEYGSNLIQMTDVDSTFIGDGVLTLESDYLLGIYSNGTLTWDGPTLNYIGNGEAIYVRGNASYYDYENAYAQAKAQGKNFTEQFILKSGVINAWLSPEFYFEQYWYPNSVIESRGSVVLEGGEINVVISEIIDKNLPMAIILSSFATVENIDCNISYYGTGSLLSIPVADSRVEEERAKQKEVKHNLIDIETVMAMVGGFKLEETEFEYTGNPIEPKVIAPEGIVEGVGYSIYYVNNTNVGQGKVIIQGLIDREFKEELTFTIKEPAKPVEDPKDLDEDKKDKDVSDGSDGAIAGDVNGTDYDKITSKKKIKVGMKLKVKKSNGIYKIIKINKKKGKITGGKLKYLRPIKRNKKTFKIVDYIVVNGIRFKVSSIGKKAWKKCKKIKKVQIRSRRVLKFKKNAFKGIKKVKLVVRKKYKKKYKKLIKKLKLTKRISIK